MRNLNIVLWHSFLIIHFFLNYEELFGVNANDMFNRVLYPYDILDFGKNKGIVLSKIYKYQPSYLEWAIINIEDFRIDIPSFEKLPNPTPLAYDPKRFTGERDSVDFMNISQEQLVSILKDLDSVNHLKAINADEVERYIEENNIKVKSINYKFPSNIIELNSLKA